MAKQRCLLRLDMFGRCQIPAYLSDSQTKTCWQVFKSEANSDICVFFSVVSQKLLKQPPLTERGESSPSRGLGGRATTEAWLGVRTETQALGVESSFEKLREDIFEYFFEGTNLPWL